MQEMKNPQGNEKATFLMENIKLMADNYFLMQEMYNEQKRDLEIALNEITRLKQQLQQTPVAKFQFNVN